MKTALLCVALSLFALPSAAGETARGVVFNDLNANGARDDGEPGLGGVRVSNGVQVVLTDPDGSYELPVDDDTIVFVAKPRGWQTRYDDKNLPRFYYIHKPAGSPDDSFKYAGVDPTGPLPESIDFPLVSAPEPDDFTAILIGDPQPYTREEVRYFANDIVAELIDTGAAFGMSMGDIVGDDLALFEHMNNVQAAVGVPWYNVYGNHDMNFHSPDDEHADETFERVYGPTDYAFQYGSVHFLPLDNVIYRGAVRDGADNVTSGGYTGGLLPHQLEFVRNYAATVPKTERIVVCTHIPLANPNEVEQGTPELAELMQILAEYPHTVSFSAHTHYQRSDSIDTKGRVAKASHTHDHVHDDHGDHEHDHDHGPLHLHHNIVTGSGSWYRGPFDESGMPMTPMRDGVPNGYVIAKFSGNEYSVRYKAARMPADYQLAIYTAEVIPAADTAAEVLANVFNGDEQSKVRMRVRGKGDWVKMQQTEQLWPPYVAARERDVAYEDRPYRDLPEPQTTPHIWKARLPAGLAAGVHVLEVETTDRFGQTDRDFRLIEVE